MKKFIRNLLVLLTLVAGTENALALGCKGTLYFKAPENWKSVYAGAMGSFDALTQGENGWWTIPMSKIGGLNGSIGVSLDYDTFFLSSRSNDYCSPSSSCVNMDVWNFSDGRSSKSDFNCHDVGEGSDMYIYENPVEPGKTVVSSNPPNAKYLYVLIPSDWDDWMSGNPMISMDGGKTGKAMKPDPDRCGWYYYIWFDEDITDNVLLFRDDDDERANMIGVNGEDEMSSKPKPIPLDLIFSVKGDVLYFIPSASVREEIGMASSDGFFTEDPQVDGNCTYSMAAFIYDTDASLHPAFSCWSQGGEGCQNGAQGISREAAIAAINACIGVTPGLVEPELDTTVSQYRRKPKLSALGKTCFIDEKYFNQLFNLTNGVNEMSCFDMPFTRAKDGKWEFDSDNFIAPGMTVKGGFYPVEGKTDASVLFDNPNQIPLPAARTPRVAESPVLPRSEMLEIDPVEGVPLIDLYCNGPGWKGGVDCGGAPGTGKEKQLFNDGEYPGVWDWGSREFGYGWPTNSMRNQHYCFESHATFTWKPGLRFSFRGDDDIWVYIDNKLAVDLGGTHLAAPGYVDLDYFKGLSGGFEKGKNYNLDIFFCDRRTTMSNVRIKTNMYIRQKSGISLKRVMTKEDSDLSYEVCYSSSGGGSCASMLSGITDVTLCGAEIAEVVPVTYYLVKGKIISLDNAVVLEPDKMNFGGIDMTDPSSVVIHTDKVELDAGYWMIVVEIAGSQKKIKSFVISEDGSFGDVPEDEPIEIVEKEDPENGSSASPSATSSSSNSSGKSSSSKKGDDKSDPDSDDGDDDDGDDGEKIQYAEPTFRVKMVAPFTFEIVFNETAETKARSYVVMDMLGSVVNTGVVTSSKATVTAPSKGSFIVKSGRHSEIVNFK